MESIVRPFQTRDVTPPRNIPSATPKKASDNVTIKISGGNPSVQQGNYELKVTYYMTKKWKELLQQPLGGLVP